MHLLKDNVLNFFVFDIYFFSDFFINRQRFILSFFFFVDEPQELILRDYQETLAQPGIEGKNNIVFAPTGSGKTIVAIKIAMVSKLLRYCW